MQTQRAGLDYLNANHENTLRAVYGGSRVGQSIKPFIFVQHVVQRSSRSFINNNSGWFRNASVILIGPTYAMRLYNTVQSTSLCLLIIQWRAGVGRRHRKATSCMFIVSGFCIYDIYYM